MVSANVTSTGGYYAGASTSSKSLQKDSKQKVTFGFMLQNTNPNEQKASNVKADSKDDVQTKDTVVAKTDKGVDVESEKTEQKDFENAINEVKNQMDKEKKSLKELELNQPQMYIIVNPQDLTAHNEQQVKEKIADTLGITTDELDAALDKLNLTVWDLTDLQNAKQLAMVYENVEDVSELLVDNDLSEKINDLSEKLSQLVSDSMETAKIETVPVDTQPTAKNMENPNENVDDTARQEAPTEVADTSIKIKGRDIEKNLENMQKDSSSENEQTALADKKSSEHLTTKFSSENANVDGILRDLTDALVEKTDGVEEARIVSQIIDQINVNAKPGVTSLEIQLYPEHLGKVIVEVSSKDGILNAKIAAETESAKNAIEGQLTLLKDSLNNQGIKVESVEVTIAGHGFEENLEKGNERNDSSSPKKRTIRKDLLDEINGIDTSEKITEEVKMQTIGNTVSYKA